MSENQRDPSNPGPDRLSFRIVDRRKDFLISKEVGESMGRLRGRILAVVNDHIRVLGGSDDLIQPEEVEYIKTRAQGSAKGLEFDSVGEEHSLLSVKLSAQAMTKLTHRTGRKDKGRPTIRRSLMCPFLGIALPVRLTQRITGGHPTFSRRRSSWKV